MEKMFTAADFDTEVLGSDKPVLVDFFATWCGPCKMMAPAVEKLAEEYEGRAVIGKLDVEESIRRITGVDLILTEGFKHGPYPKIALYRSHSGQPLAAAAEDCLAIVSDCPLEASCPQFPLDEPQPLASYLIELLAKWRGESVCLSQ